MVLFHGHFSCGPRQRRCILACQSDITLLLVIGHLSKNILFMLEAAGRVHIIECTRIGLNLTVIEIFDM